MAKSITQQKRIFFSYSWKDQPIAMRIYYDLTRSGLSVWRDNIDVEQLDFHLLEDIYSVIDKIDYFLLIDSQHARDSFYVQKEVTYFKELQKKFPSKKLIILLVGDLKTTHAYPEIFKDQNYFFSFDFSGINLYDTYKKYLQSIIELVRILGSEFISWSDMSDGKDFEDEISYFKISDEDRQSLSADFKTFKLRHQQQFPNLITRLKIIIEDCKILNISSITPFLSLGVVYGEVFQNTGDRELLIEAKQTFLIVTKRYPKDPRGWRGLGGIYFFLEEYQYALEAFDKSLHYTLLSKNPYHLKYVNLIEENKAEAYKKLGQYKKSLSIYENLFASAISKNNHTPSHFIDLSDCLIQLGDFDAAEIKLLKGLEEFKNDAGILEELGKLNIQIQNFQKGIHYYEKSVQYNPKHFETLASLCILLYFYGEPWKYKKYSTLLIQLKPISKIDHYLIGRIYFFNDDFENAIDSYNKSNYEIGPYYSNL